MTESAESMVERLQAEVDSIEV